MTEKKRASDDLSDKSHPIEESKSITGSGGAADDPKGPNFKPGPSMSTGAPAPKDEE